MNPFDSLSPSVPIVRLPSLVCGEVFRRMSAVSSMFCSSYLDGLWNRRQIDILLLFCKVLLQRFVQNSTQHPCIVFIELFSLSTSLMSRWCRYTIVMTWIQLGRNIRYFHLFWLIRLLVPKSSNIGKRQHQ